ncbi:thiamine ABC transporter substrate binding subunit [Microvirga thermotolerans]|uniref:Thiamine-binding periplasmic protein n=1 Tax=Microvirga thermotolerans TaxID=2651334 RepID=A0A5P9JXX2_9HYPH|nr:thiamine ABC transporter substrate binding subunit [Microvirga thermotolerans]QFU17712.1 thiamine ABC transporter substrate binding subunit [Microvirga thermotolerans]
MFGRIALALASLCLAAGLASAQTKPVLTVYTYSSFAGKYGPGKTVKERFEAVCNCELAWVTAEDAGSLLGRLRLEGSDTKADAVVGLDMNLAAEAKALNLFAPHGVNTEGLTLPVAWSDDTFIPYDWGYLAFVYDSSKLANPPKSLKELVEHPNGPRIVLQDPRTSAPGLGFLLWMEKIYGDGADKAWADLRPRIVTFTKGWSEAYGLFLKGEADMVMSYTTSPAYHVTVEKKNQYKAAAFDEGHYLHIELAGMTKTAKNPELARKFMEFVLSDAFQSAMPEGNWMMPAKASAASLPEAFKDAIQPSRTLLFTPDEVRENRRAFVDRWLNATAR